jgi:poly(A) polymerase
VSITFTPGFSRELVDPDGVSVVKQLQKHGYETYFVGGCVRDLLLQRPPKDFDVATAARPEDLKRIFGRRCRIIGRRFRLVHLHMGSQIYEIATFRGLPGDQEVADDDSGFVVRANTYGTPFEDAKSRDFTVNGLFYDPVAERVIDHVGGTEDVKRRILRTIGDADKRLREDPVRLLRAVKFAARLGFQIDAPIAEAAHVAAPLIQTCPAARVSEELYRIAESGHVRAAFQWMHRLGVLDALLPEIAGFFEAGHPRHGDVSRWLDQVDRLTAAHGTLPREATFALIAWPFLEAGLLSQPDVLKLNWGRYALDTARDLAVRLAVPVRHRYTLAGMADQLRRLRAFPVRRPSPHHLRAYGVPLALTAARIRFLLTGEGQEAYEAWAAEIERVGLWAAPFEPRQEELDEEGAFSEHSPQASRRQAPVTQAQSRPPRAPMRVPVAPVHDERLLDELAGVALVGNREASAEPVAARKKRRRRRRSAQPARAE